MTITILWILFSAAVAAAAKMRGRNATGWLLLSVTLSPVAAALFVLALPRLGAVGVSVRLHPDLTPIFEVFSESDSDGDHLP
jgi:hypothetical protein